MFYLISRVKNRGRKRIFRVFDTEDFVSVDIAEEDLIELMMSEGVKIENVELGFIQNLGYIGLTSKYRKLEKIGTSDGKEQTYCVIGLFVDDFGSLVGRLIVDARGNVFAERENRFSFNKYKYRIINMDSFDTGNELVSGKYNFPVFKITNYKTYPKIEINEECISWYGHTVGYNCTFIKKEFKENTIGLSESPVIEKKFKTFIDKTNLFKTDRGYKVRINNEEILCSVEYLAKCKVVKRFFNATKDINISLPEMCFTEKDKFITFRGVRVATLLSDYLEYKENKIYVLEINEHEDYVVSCFDIISGIKKDMCKLRGEPTKIVVDNNYFYILYCYDKYAYDSEAYTFVERLDFNTGELNSLGEFNGTIENIRSGVCTVHYTYSTDSVQKKLF